ncbi:MAG: glycosyltransferase family 39 protein [Rhodospirillales bacterium]|nr:glycosyltransferase family 39 protein [Rhodospirillales bacterium]
MKSVRGLDGGKDCAIVIALMLFFVSRLATYLAFGLLESGDSSGYIEFADMILRDQAYPAFDLYNTRVPGYSIVILLHKLLFGDAWRLTLYIFQCSLTFISSVCVYQIAQYLVRKRWVSFFSAFSYAFSIQMFLDGVVLADSIYTSLLIISIWFALCLRAMWPGRFLLAGIVLAFAFLFRESTLYLLFPISVFLSFAAWEDGKDRMRKGMQIVGGIAIIVAPVLGLNELIKAYHDKNYGIPAVTTGGKTVYWIALSTPYLSFFPEIFAGDDPVDQIYREEVGGFSPWDVYAATQKVFNLNSRLQKDLGYSEYEISQLGQHKYFEVMSRYPMAIGLIIGFNVRPTTVFGVFQPFQNILMLDALKTGDHSLWKTRFVFLEIFDQGKYQLLPIFLLLMCVRLINLAIFSCFAVFPFIIFRKIWRCHEIGVIGVSTGMVGLWLFYAGVWGIFALIHTEPRYLSAANISVSIIGLSVISSFLSSRKITAKTN